MIHSITGLLVSLGEQRVILRSGAVEWSIDSCLHSVEALRPRLGRRVTVFAHLYHREDQLQLFGFADEETRHAFCELIRLNGVGPKQALKILSQITSRKLWSGVQSNDSELFESISGLGKKTAAKLIISLKDRVPDISDSPQVDNGAFRDIVNGLVNMGYRREEVLRAIEQQGEVEDLTQLDESVLFAALVQQLGERDG